MAAEIRVFQDLDAAAADAGAALGRDAQPWLFDRIDWFRLVQEHTPEGKPLVVRVRNGVARCWLFLSTRGRSAEGLSNWYCLRYGAVVEGGDGTAALSELPRGLRAAGISHLFLAPIGGEDPLPAMLRRRGWAVRREQVNVSWRLDVAGMSFEEYWASRTSRLRNTAGRRARKAKLDLVVHDRFDAAAWADYDEVYNASWKPAEGSPALVRRLAEQEAAAGTLRLGLAYHEGRPVAGQLWLVENGTATIHKLAYRDDAKHLSPGTILSIEMFRRAIDEDRVHTIDFGIGNDRYKADWMSHCVPLYAVSAYDMLRPAGLAGLARATLSKLKRLAPRKRA